MKRLVAIVLLAFGLAVGSRGEPSVAPQSAVEAAVADMFKAASGDWKARTVQDETQRVCSDTHNAPSDTEARQIKAREASGIAFPADGARGGDWKKGELIAQSGAGGQFTDPPDTVHGGNCYACHQLAPSEISHGTLGPSLTGYGRTRNFAQAEFRATYAKIFNSQSVLACSTMPRFGAHKFLSIEQIEDVTAYLMSPDSPVNK